jgi:uncharacterized protein YkwD
MKLFKSLILILFTVNCVAQTKLDSLVLIEVNKYRVTNKLKQVEFSTINFKAANHHSKYISKSNSIGHLEDTLVNPIDRFKFYGGQTNHIGENVLLLSSNIKDDNVDFDRLSKEIINMWINSPEHNRILLGEDFRFASVSCVFSSKVKTGIKGWSNQKIVSTLVLSN